MKYIVTGCLCLSLIGCSDDGKPPCLQASLPVKVAVVAPVLDTAQVHELAVMTGNFLDSDTKMWSKIAEANTLMCADSKSIPYASCSEVTDEINTHRDQVVVVRNVFKALEEKAR